MEEQQEQNQEGQPEVVVEQPKRNIIPTRLGSLIILLAAIIAGAGVWWYAGSHESSIPVELVEGDTAEILSQNKSVVDREIQINTKNLGLNYEVKNEKIYFRGNLLTEIDLGSVLPTYIEHDGRCFDYYYGDKYGWICEKQFGCRADSDAAPVKTKVKVSGCAYVIHKWTENNTFKVASEEFHDYYFSEIEEINSKLLEDKWADKKQSNEWVVKYPYDVDSEHRIYCGIEPFEPACVAPETQITMVDGSTKLIKDIEEGEFLTVRNLEKNEDVSTKVLKIIEREDPIIQITTKESELLAAPDQYVYSSKGLITADSLRVGDRIQRYDGVFSNIMSLKETMKATTTYDLQLEEYRNLYANGFLIQGVLPEKEDWLEMLLERTQNYFMLGLFEEGGKTFKEDYIRLNNKYPIKGLTEENVEEIVIEMGQVFRGEKENVTASESYVPIDYIKLGDLAVFDGIVVVNVRYEDKKILGYVDQDTFQTMGDYAKDKNNVYYIGSYASFEVVDNVDVDTYEVVGTCGCVEKSCVSYTKDKNAVWCGGSKLEGADPTFFEIVGTIYDGMASASVGLDNNNMYLQSKKIDLDRTSLEFLIDSDYRDSIKYVKDKNGVYLPYLTTWSSEANHLTKIEGVDPANCTVDNLVGCEAPTE